MNKQFCYVAGPYRHDTINGIAENIAEARRVAVRCWQLGYTTITPHLNSQFMDGATDDSAFLEGDLEIMRALAATDHGCIMVLLPGWSTSSGTKNEIAEAEKLGMKVYDGIDTLIEETIGL